MFQSQTVAINVSTDLSQVTFLFRKLGGPEITFIMLKGCDVTASGTSVLARALVWEAPQETQQLEQSSHRPRWAHTVACAPKH